MKNTFILLITFLFSCNSPTKEKHNFETNDETTYSLDGIWINEKDQKDTLKFLHKQYGNMGRLNEGNFKNSIMSWEVYEPGECEITLTYTTNKPVYKVKLQNKERLSIENDVFIKLKTP